MDSQTPTPGSITNSYISPYRFNPKDLAADDYFVIQDGNEVDDESMFYDSFSQYSSQIGSQFYSQTLSALELDSKIAILKSTLKLRSTEDILLLSKTVIQNVLKVSENQVIEVIIHASWPSCANIVTSSALELLQDQTLKIPRLSFGCPIIDNALGGGIMVKGITEICGEAGCGKTQFCLQLSLQAQLPIEHGGLNGSVCYISTEGEIPLKRLYQIVDSYINKYSFLREEVMTGKVLVNKAATLEDLTDVLEKKLPGLLKVGQVRLVIVDSIAAVFRFEYAAEEAIDRSKQLWRNANQMKLLSDAFNVPFVVVNQVSDLFNDAPIFGASFIPSKTRVIPSLGLTWSNCVNTRLMLMRTRKMINASSLELWTESQPDSKKRKVDEETQPAQRTRRTAEEVVLRKMHVLLSSHLPNVSVNFIVDSGGVRGLSVDN